jgi:hypothetical protein
MDCSVACLAHWSQHYCEASLASAEEGTHRRCVMMRQYFKLKCILGYIKTAGGDGRTVCQKNRKDTARAVKRSRLDSFESLLIHVAEEGFKTMKFQDRDLLAHKIKTSTQQHNIQLTKKQPTTKNKSTPLPHFLQFSLILRFVTPRHSSFEEGERKQRLLVSLPLCSRSSQHCLSCRLCWPPWMPG